MDFAAIKTPCLMGIVNVTPDSFSDTGKHADAPAAAARARGLIAAGAGIVDLGAEASSFFRAGVEPVPADEQLHRLLPVLTALSDMPRDVFISVDTRSAAVARAAIDAGARIINDISAGLHEPELLRVVADAGVGIVLMHLSPGYPATPPVDDPDIVATTRRALGDAYARAMRAGISPVKIALDPGVGFGKTMADNWRLALRAVETLPAECPAALVLGISRKRFLETAPPADVALPAPWSALVESSAATPRICVIRPPPL